MLCSLPIDALLHSYAALCTYTDEDWHELSAYRTIVCSILLLLDPQCGMYVPWSRCAEPLGVQHSHIWGWLDPATRGLMPTTYLKGIGVAIGRAREAADAELDNSVFNAISAGRYDSNVKAACFQAENA